jgi:hypothetical protein
MQGDSEAFEAANDLLQRLRVSYRRVSRDQLKIGAINYYPNTGTITVDGESGARGVRGPQGLEFCIQASAKRLQRIIEEKRRASRNRRE